MLLVLALAAGLWGLGALMGASRMARAYMLGLLYVAVLALHVVLPEGHPARLATGGSAALWLIVGGFGGLGAAYALVLRRLKARAEAKAPVQAPQWGDPHYTRSTWCGRRRWPTCTGYSSTCHQQRPPGRPLPAR